MKDEPDTELVSGIVLRDRAGRSVSLHRYAGRWLVLRVSELAGGDHLARCCRGLDGVIMDVVIDAAVLPEGEHCTRDACTCMVDGDGVFPRWFPALRWPATFVIDPAGTLIAILTDESCEAFVQRLVRLRRPAASFGAIDLGEIDT